MFALKRDTEERSIPHKLKYEKSTTQSQNTEGELYLSNGKIISPKKKHYSPSVIGDKE